MHLDEPANTIELQIRRRNQLKESSYKTFSIRARASTVEALERIAIESNRSRNELINIMLDFCIQNYRIID